MVRVFLLFILLCLSTTSQSGSYKRALEGVVVCLDPGHGGQEVDSPFYTPGQYTGGTIGAATGQTEGDVNLRVAYKLTEILNKNGASVIMTRQHRGRIMSRPCSPRDEIEIRSCIAATYSPDIFISIHHNSAPKPKPNYTTAFHNDSKESENLANSIVHSLSKTMGNNVLKPTYGKKYRLISSAQQLMPKTLTVLVEASFMSNPEEDRKLAGEKRIREEATGIYNGIANYYLFLELYPKLIRWLVLAEKSHLSESLKSTSKKIMSTITEMSTVSIPTRMDTAKALE